MIKEYYIAEIRNSIIHTVSRAVKNEITARGNEHYNRYNFTKHGKQF